MSIRHSTALYKKEKEVKKKHTRKSVRVQISAIYDPSNRRENGGGVCVCWDGVRREGENDVSAAQ